MGDYVPQGVAPLEKCRADVHSCDIYEGIIGWRYGYVPPWRDAVDHGVGIPGGHERTTERVSAFYCRQEPQADGCRSCRNGEDRSAVGGIAEGLPRRLLRDPGAVVTAVVAAGDRYKAEEILVDLRQTKKQLSPIGRGGRGKR